MTELTN